MFKTIEGATDSEIWSVIHFLITRNVLPSEVWDLTRKKHNRFTWTEMSSYYSCCLSCTRPDDGL